MLYGNSQGYENKLTDFAWYRDNSGGSMKAVAILKPNAWGLYDMHGNSAEWVGDRFAAYASGKQVNPVGQEGPLASYGVAAYAAAKPCAPALLVSNGKYGVKRVIVAGLRWLLLNHKSQLKPTRH